MAVGGGKYQQKDFHIYQKRCTPELSLWMLDGGSDLKMIGESRWTGTTLKFGLNIEQSLGHSVAEGQPRLLGRRPPTLSSTLPTRQPKLFEGTSLI